MIMEKSVEGNVMVHVYTTVQVGTIQEKRQKGRHRKRLNEIAYMVYGQNCKDCFNSSSCSEEMADSSLKFISNVPQREKII